MSLKKEHDLDLLQLFVKFCKKNARQLLRFFKPARVSDFSKKRIFNELSPMQNTITTKSRSRLFTLCVSAKLYTHITSYEWLLQNA